MNWVVTVPPLWPNQVCSAILTALSIWAHVITITASYNFPKLPNIRMVYKEWISGTKHIYTLTSHILNRPYIRYMLRPLRWLVLTRQLHTAFPVWELASFTPRNTLVPATQWSSNVSQLSLCSIDLWLGTWGESKKIYVYCLYIQSCYVSNSFKNVRICKQDNVIINNKFIL